MIMPQQHDLFGDFDFSRSDKQYVLLIPRYTLEKNVVYYHFQLKDLIRNQTHFKAFRYNQLKNIHQQLSKLDYQMPPFPVTHFWSKTNKNPVLIEQRRMGLQDYFSRIINDPYIRGYKDVKRIIALCKEENHNKRRLSEDKKTVRTTLTRSHSASKSNSKNRISKDYMKKLLQNSPKKTI